VEGSAVAFRVDEHLLHGGGISTAKRRTFVSRDCAYFQVDVEFRRAVNSGIDSSQSEFLEELDDDVITKISGPFLRFVTTD